VYGSYVMILINTVNGCRDRIIPHLDKYIKITGSVIYKYETANGEKEIFCSPHFKGIGHL